MKNLIIGLIILSLLALVVGIKNFTLGQDNENKNGNEHEVLKSEDVEKSIRKEFKGLKKALENIFDEIEKPFRIWRKGVNFFSLTPSGEVMAGGKVENSTTTSFTLNSGGFRTNWVFATETKVLSPEKRSLNIRDIQNDDFVRIKGKFDGQNLLTQHIIVFKIKPQTQQVQEIQDLLLQIINRLREKDVDVTPILQRLQLTTTTQ